MTTLAELQKKFFSDVCAHDYEPVSDWLQSNHTLDTSTALHIYRHNRYSQLSKALQGIYPACVSLVGKNFFQALVDTYIDQNSSTFIDLNDYGEKFPDSILKFEPANVIPYLGDVARLEWAWHKAYGAANTTSTPAMVDEGMLVTSPGSTVLHSPYPIDTLWQFSLTPSDNSIELESDADFYFFIHRKGYQRRIERLTKIEFITLRFLQTKQSLHTVCLNHPTEVTADILAQLLSKKWLIVVDKK